MEQQDGRWGQQGDGDTRPRSASGASASGADSITERWTIQEGQSRVIDIDAVHALKVGIVGGSVDIVGHDEATARVEVHRVEGPDLAVSLEQGRLQVAHMRMSWDDVWSSIRSLAGGRARVELSILVPRDVDLTLGQVTASGLISGLQARASASTVSGALQVESHRGPLDVNTVSGDVEASDVGGRVNVHSISGEVAISGALEEAGVDTVSGDVLLDVHGSPRAISVNAVSADVAVRLDADQGARVSTRTVSGRGTVGGRALPKRGGNESLEGRQPFGLSANTVSGAVTVVRRDV